MTPLVFKGCFFFSSERFIFYIFHQNSNSSIEFYIFTICDSSGILSNIDFYLITFNYQHFNTFTRVYKTNYFSSNFSPKWKLDIFYLKFSFGINMPLFKISTSIYSFLFDILIIYTTIIKYNIDYS